MEENLRKLMTLAQLGKAIGKSYGAVSHMYNKGRIGVSGNRVFLWTYRTEGGMKSSMEAYHRFLSQLNDKNYKGPDFD